MKRGAWVNRGAGRKFREQRCRTGPTELIAGFLALLAYDISTVRQGIAPRWYTALRVQLTLAVVALPGITILARM